MQQKNKQFAWKKITFDIFFVLLGFITCIFCRFHFNFFICFLIFPICFLNFSRKNKAIYSLPIIFVAITIGLSISLWTTLEIFDLTILIRLALGFFHFLPFLFESVIFRQLFNKRQNLINILFALSWVICEWLFSLINPFGNAGCLTYSMVQVLPFCQIVSVLGLGFLTFIILYFCASLSTLFVATSKQIAFKQMISSIILLFINFTYSGSCLITQNNNKQTINVMLTEGIYVEQQSSPNLNWFDTLQKDLHVAKDNYVDLLAYCETYFSFSCYSKDDKELENELESIRQQCQEIFKNSSICAVITWLISNFDDDNQYKSWNEAWLINGFNNEIVVYQKKHGVPFEGIIKGDGKIKCTNTPFGKIATAICLDLEFDSYIAQVGRQAVDILVAPSSDWPTVQNNHSLTNAFRALENGVNLIKPTCPGNSIVVNCNGEILLNYHTDNYSDNINKHFNIVTMPSRGKFTIYPYLATFINYLYLIAFFSLLIFFLYYDLFIVWIGKNRVKP